MDQHVKNYVSNTQLSLLLKSELKNAVKTNNTAEMLFSIIEQLSGTGFLDDIRYENTGDTLLHHALFAEKWELALSLLEDSSVLNIKNNKGMTPLYVVIDAIPTYKSGPLFHEEIVRMMIERGADPNIEDNEGLTPLHVAAVKCNQTVVRLLLQKSSNVNAKSCGFTPLEYVMKEEISYKILWRAIEVMKILLENGAETECLRNYIITKATLPQRKCKNAKKNVDGVIKEIANFLVNPKKKEGDPYPIVTPLHRAAAEGSCETVEQLLQLGADPNVAGWHGQIPFQLAICKSNTKVAELLLTKTADLNIQDDYGNTALHLAIRHDQYTIVNQLLEKGANPLLKNNKNETVLDCAASQYRYKIPQALLKASIHNRNNKGQTALHLASEAGSLPILYNEDNDLGMRYEIIEQLLEAGAEIDLQDVNGDTPLHLAAKANSSRLVTLLLKKGASPNITNNDGKLPRFCAGSNSAAYSAFINYSSGDESMSDDQLMETEVDSSDGSCKSEEIDLMCHSPERRERLQMQSSFTKYTSGDTSNSGDEFEQTERVFSAGPSGSKKRRKLTSSQPTVKKISKQSDDLPDRLCKSNKKGDNHQTRHMLVTEKEDPSARCAETQQDKPKALSAIPAVAFQQEVPSEDLNFEWASLRPPLQFVPSNMPTGTIQQLSSGLLFKVSHMAAKDKTEAEFVLAVLSCYPDLPEALKPYTFQRLNLLFLAVHYGWKTAVTMANSMESYQ